MLMTVATLSRVISSVVLSLPHSSATFLYFNGRIYSFCIVAIFSFHHYTDVLLFRKAFPNIVTSLALVTRAMVSFASLFVLCFKQHLFFSIVGKLC